jgi:hypothetical protein
MTSLSLDLKSRSHDAYATDVCIRKIQEHCAIRTAQLERLQADADADERRWALEWARRNIED